MNILFDNTGFQNFGLCFHRSLDPDNIKYGVRDFLQFCIQIIFYDKFTISTIVPKSIMEKSNEIIENINTKSNDIIDIENLYLQDNEFDNILDDIAEEFFNRLTISFEKCKKFTSIKIDQYSLLPSLSVEENKMFSLATDAIKNKNMDIILKFIEKSKNEKIDSSFFDIITREIKSSGNIRIIDRLFDFISETGTWNNLMGDQLVGDLRYITNQFLSYKFERPYVPAVIRAAEYMKNRHEIYLTIDNIFKIISKVKFKWANITLPSLEEYLLIKGRGSPEKIFDTALETRRVFTSVRDYIRNSESQEFTSIEYSKRLEHLKKLASDVYNDLNSGLHSENKNVVENMYAIPHYINIEKLKIDAKNAQIAIGININQNMENNINKKNDLKDDLDKCMRAFSEITNKMKKEIDYSYGNNDALDYKKILEENCVNRNTKKRL